MKATPRCLAALSITGLLSSSNLMAVEEFRKTQPKVGEPRAFQLPAMQTFTLNNGLKVFLMESHSLPTISLDLSFDNGSLSDPKDQVGRASVCMDIMTRGTKSLDRMAWNEKLADMASKISSYAGKENQGISLSTLTKNFDDTFELFKDVLTDPGMRADEFDRLIKSKLADLKQTKGSAPSVARRVSNSLLYGLDHPNGRVDTEAGYHNMSAKACTKYLKDTIRPIGARLFVVGDMTEQQVKTHFDSIKGWSGNSLTLKAPPAPKPRQGKIFFVDIPGAAQSYVGLRNFGPERSSPEYFNNLILSKIYGGGFSSRINMNLREDKGYTYGARGGFYYSKYDGNLKAGSTVRSDTTYSSIKELYNELKDLQTNTKPPTKEELSREKNGAILGLPGKFATSSRSLNMYRELIQFNLPLDYYSRYPSQIASVTINGISKAASRNFDVDSTKILVVGNGSNPVTHRVDGKDIPLMKDGKQVTLLESLKMLKGEVIVMDVDAR